MKRYTGAWASTGGLELIRRRFGPAGFRDSGEADAWARTQSWYPRIVHRKLCAGWWCWTVRL